MPADDTPNTVQSVELAERLANRWWSDVWRDGNLAALDEILIDPFVRHSSNGSKRTSVAEYRCTLAGVQRTIYRPSITINERAFDGPLIWTRATLRGTNLETGEATTLCWLMLQRVENGRIAEHWTLTSREANWSD